MTKGDRDVRFEVALFAHLTPYLPDADAARTPGSMHTRTMDLPGGTTVGQVITTLGLPDEPRIVFVNGRHAPDGHVLADGERLAIFPPVAGG